MQPKWHVEPEHDPGIYERHELTNGIPVFFKHVTKQFGLPVTEVDIMVNVGSREDESGLEGTAHYLEHVVFQGTEQYPSKDAISKPVDAASAYHNAFTSKEWTSYSMYGPTSFFGSAVDILADQVLRPLITAKNVEHERRIILEEEKSKTAQVSYFAYLKAQSLRLGSHPMGRPNIGTQSSISQITTEAIQRFHANNYRASRIQILVTGDITITQVLDTCEAKFGHLTSEPRYHRPNPFSIQGQPRHRRAYRPAGYNRSCTIISRVAPRLDFYQERIVSLYGSMLNMGTTSPLFTELREEKQLCYGYHLDFDVFSDYAAWEFEVEASRNNIPIIEDIFWAILPKTLNDEQRFDEVKERRLTNIMLSEFGIGDIHRGARSDLMVHHEVIPLQRDIDAYQSMTHPELVANLKSFLNPADFYTVVVEKQ